MSIYLDTITLILSLVALAGYSHWVVTKPNIINITGFMCIVFYLFAQTGWTVAFFQGDVWGRDFNNYIWFAFNTSVIALLGLIWFDRKQ